jgi:hypothetical protein
VSVKSAIQQIRNGMAARSQSSEIWAPYLVTPTQSNHALIADLQTRARKKKIGHLGGKKSGGSKGL